MKRLSEKERCQAMVSDAGAWGAFHQHQCHKKTIVEHDGKWYCKIHNPEYIKEKERIRTEKYQQKWDKRRLELYAPMLFKACQEALEANYDPKVEKILMDAIAKADNKITECPRKR